MLNKTFYPTPKYLISKMVSKLQNKDARTYLDPSATIIYIVHISFAFWVTAVVSGRITELFETIINVLPGG